MAADAPVLPVVASDKIGWIALLAGTAIIAWSGVLARAVFPDTIAVKPMKGLILA